MKTLAMMSLLLCGAVASAGIPSDVDWENITNDTRFVKLTMDETSTDWGTGDWSTKWSSSKPEAGNWYFTNGKRLFVPSGMTDPFPGDLLVLNSQFRNPSYATWKVKDFVALSGGFIGIRTTKEGGGLFVGGDMLVRTSDEPFRIVADDKNRKKDTEQEIELNVTGALTGDETAEIHFGSSAGVYDGAEPTSNQFLSAYTLKVTAGEATNYNGRLTLDDASLKLCSDFGGTVELKNVRLGTELSARPYPKLTLDGCSKLGGLVVNECVAITNTASAVTVDTLTLAPGAEFNLDKAGTWKIGKIVGKGGRLVFSRKQGSSTPIAGDLEITEGFDPQTRITITNTASAWSSLTPKSETRIALLRIAASVDPASVSLDRFRLERTERTGAVYGCFPIQDLELQENPDGSHTLFLVGREVVTVVSKGEFNYPGPAEKWSDGQLPHADKDYFIVYTNGATKVVFTEDTVFPGPNTLVRKATLKIHADVTIPNLVLARETQLEVSASTKTDRTNRISGRIGIYGEVTDGEDPSKYTSVFTPNVTSDNDPFVLDVASDLYGPGVLQLRNNGIVRLTGDNSAFSGRIIWYLNAVDPASNQTILEIDNDTSLGGELPASDPAAIVIANNGTIRALNTLSLASETRGIQIQGSSVFEAPEGVTFSIANPLDYEATLTKTGAGILALGGTPTVGEEGRLVVAEGTLKPISGTALNGLPVEFANGTELHIDPAKTPQGVEIGDLTVAPGTKLTVRILGQDDGSQHHETVPLLVFPTVDKAEAALAVLKVKSPYAHHSARLSVVETVPGGPAQIQAEIQGSGFVLMIR